MLPLEQLKHCILNGHILLKLEQEREAWRHAFLSKDAAGEDTTVALARFHWCSKKSAQVQRLKNKLVTTSQS